MHYQFNRITQFMQTLLSLMGVNFCIPLEHTWPISMGNEAFTDTRFDSSKKSCSATNLRAKQ